MSHAYRPNWTLYKIDGDHVLVTPTIERNSRGKFDFQIWRINEDCPPNLRDQFGMTFIYTVPKNNYDLIAEVYRNPVHQAKMRYR